MNKQQKVQYQDADEYIDASSYLENFFPAFNDEAPVEDSLKTPFTANDYKALHNLFENNQDEDMNFIKISPYPEKNYPVIKLIPTQQELSPFIVSDYAASSISAPLDLHRIHNARLNSKPYSFAPYTMSPTHKPQAQQAHQDVRYLRRFSVIKSSKPVPLIDLTGLPDSLSTEVEATPAPPQLGECCICFENKCEVAFAPCGHISCCDSCSKKCQDCPVCRKKIESSLRVYFAGNQ